MVSNRTSASGIVLVQNIMGAPLDIFIESGMGVVSNLSTYQECNSGERFVRQKIIQPRNDRVGGKLICTVEQLLNIYRMHSILIFDGHRA